MVTSVLHWMQIFRFMFISQKTGIWTEKLDRHCLLTKKAFLYSPIEQKYIFTQVLNFNSLGNWTKNINIYPNSKFQFPRELNKKIIFFFQIWHFNSLGNWTKNVKFYSISIFQFPGELNELVKFYPNATFQCPRELKKVT